MPLHFHVAIGREIPSPTGWTCTSSGLISEISMIASTSQIDKLMEMFEALSLEDPSISSSVSSVPAVWKALSKT
jgi:hypothetical protein